MSEQNKVDLPTFYGIKSGMTRIFDQNGNHVPVTVIKLIPNFISQVKTKQKDGYEAYQIAYNEKRDKLITSPTKGHLAKAKIAKNFSRFKEVRINDVKEENLGMEISLDNFKPSTYIDVTGVSKGKGFQGAMKRYGFSGGPATHGSHFHRRTGAIGNRATPGKVRAGKKMPGHMGCKPNTIQNLLIQDVNIEKGYLLIKGSVPGGKNGLVRISKAVKK